MVDHPNRNDGMEGQSGNPGYNSRIHGVINIAGALISTDVLDAGEPGLYSVHGTADEVVPYSTGESDGSGVSTEGSGLIHPRASALGIPNELRRIDGGDHGAFFECDDCAAGVRAFVYSNL